MTARRLDTIATRLAVTAVVAIVIGFATNLLGSFLVARFTGARAIAVSSGISVSFGKNPAALASQVVTAVSILESVQGADGGRIVSVMDAGRPDLQICLRDQPVPGPAGSWPLVKRLIEVQLGGRPVRLSSVEPGRVSQLCPHSDPVHTPAPPYMLIQVPLADGRWAVIVGRNYPRTAALWLRDTVLLTALATLLTLLCMLTSSGIAAPITRFSRAAERFGVDASAPAIAERGPYELRKATRAFNLMQERLRRFVQDRTQMLAAMSHDLRTPLNRLRLRTALIDDEEQQRKMRADLEAMSVMIDCTLAFMRDDSAREPRTLVDIGVLVQDVCEDASDAGGAVSCSGRRGVLVQCRPVGIARAVANLVDNAIKYGRAARVCILQHQEHVVIEIEDDGPGIPPEEQEKVFTPFYRLEPSRSSATGGVGLGLSVARSVAREHGGDITLTNCVAGGLLVRMCLPVL